ncbi:unnamed protein product [Mytilus coruscus]|uniref:Integrase catalytic domain-containing protein n=1 Tax=Mytilus coruscus TaxID=42192 RepID=A0A6J8ATP6_MYTCO|nr:unnamed protein product [Mytilus coruscus]
MMKQVSESPEECVFYAFGFIYLKQRIIAKSTPYDNYNRHHFNTRVQNSSESIDQYLTDLKLIAKDCEFEHLKDGLIRERIVCGTNSSRVKERLLREDGLTLNKAVGICRADEESRKQMKTFNEKEQVHALRRKTQNHRTNRIEGYAKKDPSERDHEKRESNSSFSCGKCGTTHERRNCPAYDKKCHKCKKPNYYQKFSKSVHELDEYSSCESCESDGENYFVGAVNRKTEIKENACFSSFKFQVWGTTRKEQDDRLRSVLNRCQEVGLKLNAEKCKFRVKEVTYIGHTLSADGVRPDQEKIRAIKEMPAPTDKKGQQAFERLKDIITKSPVLSFYDVSKPVTVSCDASECGLGPMLIQDNKPVAYASRSLTDAESRYANIERELLGVLFGLERFNNYRGKNNYFCEYEKEYAQQTTRRTFGIEKTRKLARDSIFWPGINAQITDFISKCSVCLESKRSNTKEPMIESETPELPWMTVGTDIFYWNNNNSLIIVDYYSRYFEIAKLENIRASCVITHMQSVFARHGIPSKVRCDSGSQYVSAEFRQFTESWGFTHTVSSPHYQQSNGLVERFVQSVKKKKMLSKSKQGGKDPYIAMLKYRNTPLKILTHLS